MKRKLIAALAASAVLVGASLTAVAPANADGIEGWDHDNYTGDHWFFGRGVSNVGTSANDRMTSLKVLAPANYAILYEHASYGGRASTTFYVGTSNLGWFDFNDITSSIR
jgi:hypothetical protein